MVVNGPHEPSSNPDKAVCIYLCDNLLYHIRSVVERLDQYTYKCYKQKKGDTWLVIGLFVGSNVAATTEILLYIQILKYSLVLFHFLKFTKLYLGWHTDIKFWLCL